MSKLAAQDFEDLLQVWTPWHIVSVSYHLHTVRPPSLWGLSAHTEGNMLLTTLLFNLAAWHAYAKLRLHTDMMLKEFRTLTSSLGRWVYIFIKDVCSQYDITKLPHEMATCSRREAVLVKKSGIPSAPQQKPASTCKHLNLSTYKYHMLGNYPDLIAQFGTTDNASTQTVRFFPKNLYCCWSQYRENYSTNL